MLTEREQTKQSLTYRTNQEVKVIYNWYHTSEYIHCKAHYRSSTRSSKCQQGHITKVKFYSGILSHGICFKVFFCKYSSWNIEKIRNGRFFALIKHKNHLNLHTAVVLSIKHLRGWNQNNALIQSKQNPGSIKIVSSFN